MKFTGDLREKDFSGRDLANAIFLNADLYRTRFEGADLAGATLENCFAAEASFVRARCLRLRALRSNFYRCTFRGADLTEALVLDSVLAGADLRSAKLRRLTVTLDCNSFEEVQLDRAASAELAYLFGRVRSPYAARWLDVLGEHERARLERLFAR